MNWMQFNGFFMLNRTVWLIKMDIELDVNSRIFVMRIIKHPNNSI